MFLYDQPEDESQWKITPRRPNPKHMAEQFLHFNQVEYNDLITGDHAADLLAKWILWMTDWKHYWDIQDCLNEIRKYEIAHPPFYMRPKKEK